MMGRLRLLAQSQERGSAVVEAAFMLALLVVPTFYLMITGARVQAGVYAATAAARESGRAFATAEEEQTAPARALVASRLALESHGFTPDHAQITTSCATNPCLTPGASVTMQSEVTVSLPLIPDFMSGAVPTVITVSAEHQEPIDEFRSSTP